MISGGELCDGATQPPPTSGRIPHGDMAPTATLAATPGGAAATTAAPPARLDRRRGGADRPVRAGADRLQTAVDAQPQPDRSNHGHHHAPPGRPAHSEHEVGHGDRPNEPDRRPQELVEDGAERRRRHPVRQQRPAPVPDRGDRRQGPPGHHPRPLRPRRRRHAHPRPALQYEIHGVVGTTRIVYWHTSVEGISHYYQVIAWTGASHAAEDGPILRSVVTTLREIAG